MTRCIPLGAYHTFCNVTCSLPPCCGVKAVYILLHTYDLMGIRHALLLKSGGDAVLSWAPELQGTCHTCKLSKQLWVTYSEVPIQVMRILQNDKHYSGLDAPVYYTVWFFPWNDMSWYNVSAPFPRKVAALVAYALWISEALATRHDKEHTVLRESAACKKRIHEEGVLWHLERLKWWTTQ